MQAFPPSPYAGNGYGGGLQDSANGFPPQGGYTAPTAPSHPANGFDGYEARAAGGGPGAAAQQRPSWPAAPAQQNGSYARFKVCATLLGMWKATAACLVSIHSASVHLGRLFWAGQHPHTCRSMQSTLLLATEAFGLPVAGGALTSRPGRASSKTMKHTLRRIFVWEGTEARALLQ
jgi:hypothetical protein